jgi:SAM-dependent methyltransferase
MNRTSRDGSWAGGSSYEPYVGRWSRLVACEFLSWLQVPVGQTWLDVGCGTGALSQTLLDVASPRYVVGVDASDGYLEDARRQVRAPNACFDVSDAGALDFMDSSYDAAVSGLVLNFVAEPQRAVAEMTRVVRERGLVAVYVWDYAGEMQLMRHFWDAAAELDPAARELDEGARFPICCPIPLKRLFQSAGLEQVEVRAIDVPTVFSDFDDYWLPFLGAQGPAPGYAMSLSEGRRAALRERLRAGLPTAQDGSIHMSARAWAVRGTRGRGKG